MIPDQISRPSVPRRERRPAPPEIAAVLLSMLVLGGCSAAPLKRVPVEGHVSVDGAPLKSGAIRFIPTEKSQGPAAVATIEDGVFVLPPEEGPVVGKHRVEIDGTNEGTALDDEKAFAQKAEQGQPVITNAIPPTFNRKSTLTVELDEDGNTDLDFPLTSAGVVASK